MSGLKLTPWQQRRLQRQLQQTQDAHLYRRTLAVLEFARGKPPAVIAAALGVSRQSISNWVRAYTARHDPADRADGPRPGRPLLDRGNRVPPAGAVGACPHQLGYPAVNGTVPLLREALQDGTGRWVSDDTVRRALDRF